MRRSILITGCSSGIGFNCALKFQQRGWQVIASCRNAEDAKFLKKTYGLDIVCIDYEKPATIENGFKEALAFTGGRLDVLFNNGAYAIPAAVEDVPTDALRAIFEANFFGWHTLTRLALPVMFAQKSGRIIQNSSVLGFAAMRFRGAYVASKFALEGLTDTMRLELDGSGVHAILIEPGPIRTKIRENAFLQFNKWINWQEARQKSTYQNKLIPRLSMENPGKDLFELPAASVSEAVWKASTARKPRARYRVTWATTLMMLTKRLTPTWLADNISKRH
jgi:NAD(P)-dependent dehydrogenase (short-subunit alcohol dehydrogenase family)